MNSLIDPWIRGAAAVAAGLVLAGCAVHAERRTRSPADVTAVHTVDPVAVPGMTTVTRDEQDGMRRLYAAYPKVPGADALTARLAAAVREQIRPFLADTADAAPLPDGGLPELNVQWSLTAASPQVVGVRLVTWQFLGASGGESRRTFWYDSATRTAHPSADLLNGRAGLNALAGRVRERLGSRADPAQVRADERTFPSLAFNEGGDLVVEFSDYTVAPGSAGRVAVALDRAVYEPMLSAFGKRARDAAVAGRPRPAQSSPPVPRPSPRHIDCARAKCIALTFDDGPGPDSRRLLRALAARQARATFFVVGDNASAAPALLRETAAGGNELGNHTQSHRDLTRQPTLRVNSDLQRTQEFLRGTLGWCIDLMRPPYGATSSTVSGVAKSLELVQVLWNVDPQDLRRRDARAVAEAMVARARPGAVVLLHDTHKPTVDAMPDILTRLAAQGYTFVTVSELMAGHRIPVGGRFSGF